MEKRPLYGCIFTTRMSLSCIPKANNYHERAVCTICSSFRARNRIHLTRLTTSPRHFLDNPIASTVRSHASIASTVRSHASIASTVRSHASIASTVRSHASIASTIRSHTIDRFDDDFAAFCSIEGIHLASSSHIISLAVFCTNTSSVADAAYLRTETIRMGDLLQIDDDLHMILTYSRRRAVRTSQPQCRSIPRASTTSIRSDIPGQP